jgi:hypothetical protein
MAVELRTTMQGNAQYLAPAYSDIVIYAEGIPQNIIDTGFNVKYLVSLSIDGVNVATLKAPVDSNGKAIFRISSILQDYTETDKSGYSDSDTNSTFNGNNMLQSNHAIHQIDKYARNKNNLHNCICIGGYEYSTTINGTIITSGSLSSDVNFNFFNSVLQHNAGYSTEDFSDYLLTNDTKKFLSKFPNTSQKIQLSQYHTLAFLNGKHYLDSEITGIKLQTFDNTDTLIETQTINNTLANGGAPFGLAITANIFTGTSNTEQGLLYFGCGTAQLEQLGFTMTNVVYYTVVALNGGTEVSKTYRFDIQDADCKGFENIRLAFLNSLGAWDYYNFTKKSVRKTQINKTAIKQNYGTIPYLATTIGGDNLNYDYYNQGTYDGGTRAFNVNAIETIEANTDFITEDEAAILEELFLSPDVYMQTGTTFEPVVINETEYIKQTTANDMLKQYIITVEKSHNTRVQRL